MKISNLFAVPIAEFWMDDPDDFCEELRTVFLEKEQQGDRFRNEIQRDTPVRRSLSVPSPMKISDAFSVPIAEFSLESPADFWTELIDLLLAQEGQGEKFGKTGQHGNILIFESHSDLFNQEDPLLRQISAFCHVALASVIRQLTDHTDAEFEKLVFDPAYWLLHGAGFQVLINQ